MTNISIMSLNLHAYHPMGEPLRLIETREGKIEEAESMIFFFKEKELERGHFKRLNALSKDILTLSPDFIFLQEVTAGNSASSKTCKTFYEIDSSDKNHINSAVRLWKRLENNYSLNLSCRGNIGWITTPSTFKNKRILAKRNNETTVVHDFDSNPYPSGMVVEGFAILVKKDWNILLNETISVPYNFKNDSFVFQYAVVEKGNQKLALLNIHAANKVAHFEQAQTLRAWITQKIDSSTPVIVAGDFNATIYRPNDIKDFQGEISTVPWEMSVSNQFDVLTLGRGRIIERLFSLNEDKTYKPWSQITDQKEARLRISQAVNSLFLQVPHERQLYESVYFSIKSNNCINLPMYQSTCAFKDRIDNIFIDTRLKTLSSTILYSTNDWYKTEGVSDHPAVITEISF